MVIPVGTCRYTILSDKFDQSIMELDVVQKDDSVNREYDHEIEIGK